ncbi:MAG: HypC/HybG/HupF family hydrogenase formation chaperone [Candidatus Moraniibacteriota bacterium]
MCLAFPGKIKKIKGQNAVVDFDGIEKEINISLVSDVKKGDFVIVHAGFAIEKVSQENKDEMDDMLKSL